MFYFAVLIGEYLGGFARNFLQIFEYSYPFIHFLYGVRTEQVEVDRVQFQIIRAVITFRPFLGIAHRTYAAQVHAGNEVTLSAIFDEVREGQIGGIGV